MARVISVFLPLWPVDRLRRQDGTPSDRPPDRPLVLAGRVGNRRVLTAVDAAAAGVAQLQTSGLVPLEVARWGVLGVLGTSSLAKTLLAFASGGGQYGSQVALGLIGMVTAAGLGMLL